MKAQKKKRIIVPNAAMVTDRYSDREQNAGREMNAEGVAVKGQMETNSVLMKAGGKNSPPRCHRTWLKYVLVFCLK